jgi:hypothetical protein
LALVAAGVVASCVEAEPEPVPVGDYCEPDLVHGQPIECCRICALGQEVFGGCDLTIPPSEWPGRSATWNEWRQWCDGSRVSAGRCSNGLSYVGWWAWPGAGETRFFDEDGRFLALEGYADFAGDVCGFEWYWPKAVDCDLGARTEEMGCGAPS